jgi:selenocysteine lyase/cysteine desulfurase
MSKFRDHFALNRDISYLNAAYMGPMPIVSGQAGVNAVERRVARYWEFSPSEFFEATEKLRASVAILWGTLPRNIAIIPSVSYGAETAAHNIPLESGDEILIPQDDFPSDVYPWLEAAKRTGAVVNFVARPLDFDWTRAFLERIGPQTKIVSVPLSDWSDGTRFDLRSISQACKGAGARLVVDVSQSFGAVPFAISDFDPDFVFSVGYKWQLGPYGLSYMYVADRWHDGVPLENNWLNRRGSEDFSRLIEYRSEYQDGARRFDSGQRSQFNLTPMAVESMMLLREVTVSEIYTHVSGLVAELNESLLALGYLLPAPHFLAGHMLGARHRNWPDMSPLVKRLKERGVFVSARGSALRVSPHLYNDREDILRFLEALV